jgi:hypothetical protein
MQRNAQARRYKANWAIGRSLMIAEYLWGKASVNFLHTVFAMQTEFSISAGS